MADVYYELENAVEIGNAGELTIPRAGGLMDAVRRDRDYSLVRILRHVKGGASTTECLIVDVECDGVPPKNPVGIRYLERLALCVPSDPKQLIEVLALRQDFPDPDASEPGCTRCAGKPVPLLRVDPCGDAHVDTGGVSTPYPVVAGKEFSG